MPRVLLSSYVKRDTYFHRLNPITKLVITVTAIVLVFVNRSFIHNLIIFLLIFPIAYYSKLLKEVFKPIKYLFIIFVILFGIQGFLYPFSKTPLIQFPYGITLWYEGVIYAASISSRLIVMLVFGYWFMLTTHPGDLVSELKERGLPHWVGYVIITTLQMIPRVSSQMETIIEAQRSRGLETQGSIIKRFKAYTPLLGPLFMSSIQQAVERSMALEARAFSAKTDKTRYRDVKIRSADKQWVIVSIIFGLLFGVFSWLA